MSERAIEDILRDIQESIRRIQTYTQTMEFGEFLTDTKTQDAVIRNLEIIGEATKGLPASFRDNHPGIPWKGMAGVRDRLIHDYFGVNFDIVWTIVTVELISLQTQISDLLKKNDENQDSN